MLSKVFADYQPKPDLLANKIIVVTGAGSGIGRAVSLACAQYGATVVLLGRTLSKLETVYDEIENAGGPQPAIFPINFESATEQDYNQLQTVLKEEFGLIDAVLHNAAELGNLKPVDNIKEADWEKTLKVNLTAPYMTTKALLPLLRLSADGRVVFTSSSVGEHGRAFWGAYAASKGGIDNLTQTLAEELEQTQVKVLAVNPGATRTQMRAVAMPAEDPDTLTTPEQLVLGYLYLFGPEGQKHHGEVVKLQS